MRSLLCNVYASNIQKNGGDRCDSQRDYALETSHSRHGRRQIRMPWSAKIRTLGPEQAAVDNRHDGRVPSRSFEVAIDTNDPQRLRRFWKAALGHVKQTTPEGAIDLVDPAGRRPTIWFQQVPEPKTVKNRLHFGPTRHGCRTRSTHPTAHRPARRDPGASPVHRHGRSGRKRTIPHRGLNSTR